MTKKELNNLIKEELEAAIKGHPSYLEEAEDMDPGEMEGEEGEDDIMDSLQDFYEKLKAHFEAGGEEKTEEEEDEMEKEEDAEEMEEGKKRKAKKGDKEEEEEKVDEIALNESVKRFKKLANING